MDANVCLAVVSNRQIKSKTTLSLLELALVSPQIKEIVVANEGYTTSEGRSYCVVQAQRANCSHILFIDDDMTFPEDTLSQLLSHKKEVVGVASNSRVLPLSTTVMMMDENGEFIPEDRIAFPKMPTELFECFAVGMGVCLIDMNVFNKIEKPYFAFQSDENGKVQVGEDAWFCKQAKKVGVKIYCDPTIKVGHLGDYIY